MIYFREESIRAKKGPPALEDGVSDLEDTVVGLGIVDSQSRFQVLSQLDTLLNL